MSNLLRRNWSRRASSVSDEPRYTGAAGQNLIWQYDWPFPSAQAILDNAWTFPGGMLMDMLPGLAIGVRTASSLVSVIPGPDGVGNAGRLTYPALPAAFDGVIFNVDQTGNLTNGDTVAFLSQVYQVSNFAGTTCTLTLVGGSPTKTITGGIASNGQARQQGNTFLSSPEDGSLVSANIPGIGKKHCVSFPFRVTGTPGDVIRVKNFQMWQEPDLIDQGPHAEWNFVDFSGGNPPYFRQAPGDAGTNLLFHDYQFSASAAAAPFMSSLGGAGWFRATYSYMSHTPNAGTLALYIQVATMNFNSDQTSHLANGDIIALDSSISTAVFQISNFAGTSCTITRQAAGTSATKTFTGGVRNVSASVMLAICTASQASEPTFKNGATISIALSASYWNSPGLVSGYDGDKRCFITAAIAGASTLTTDHPEGVLKFSSTLDGCSRAHFGGNKVLDVSLGKVGVQDGLATAAWTPTIAHLAAIRPGSYPHQIHLGGDQTLALANPFTLDFGPITWWTE